MSGFRFELLEILRNNGMTIPDYEKKTKKNMQGSKKRRSRHKTRLASLPTADYPLGQGGDQGQRPANESSTKNT